MRKQETSILLLLAAAQFCNIMDFMIMMPLGHQMMEIFSISARQFSFLVSAYSLSAGLSGFGMTFFADRFGRKKLLLTIFAGFSFGTLTCALSPTYEILLIARFCTGIFGGVMGSVVLSIVSDLVPLERRGEAMGILNTAFSVASVVGVPLGLFLADRISWHSPFLFVVMITIPLWFLLHRKLPRLDEHVASKRELPLKVLKNILGNSNQANALLFVTLVIFSHFVIVPFLSPSMVANVGFSQGQLTWIYFFGGLVSIVTGPWIGRLADRVGKKYVFTVAGFAVFFPVLCITQMGKIPLWMALSITTLFFICTSGRNIPAMALASGTVHANHRGSFMSLQSCLQQLAMGAASFLAGLIVITEPTTGKLLHYDRLGYISVLGGLVCLYLVRRIQIPGGKEHGIV